MRKPSVQQRLDHGQYLTFFYVILSISSPYLHPKTPLSGIMCVSFIQSSYVTLMVYFSFVYSLAYRNGFRPATATQ